MELFKASNQWATRPADERFWSIQEAERVCGEYYQSSFEESLEYNQLLAVPDGKEMRITTRRGKMGGYEPALLSNHAFGQLCRLAEPSAPPSYLRKLSTELASENLNFGLAEREGTAKLLFHDIGQKGNLILRASTSELYSRLWNWQIFDQLADLPDCWRVPPARALEDDPRKRPATAEDIAGLPTSIRIGEIIGPAGIYASDHDMFVFMVNADRTIDDNLSRGFFIWNSEVGEKSFGFCAFLFNHVCGNHIVWGAQHVVEFRMRHVGSEIQNKAFKEMQAEIVKYSDKSVSEELAIIEKAKTLRLGDSKEEVLAVFLALAQKISIPEINQKVAESAYAIAENREERYGDPKTLWALSNGISEFSQTASFADTRNRLDRAAGRVLEAIN